MMSRRASVMSGSASDRDRCSSPSAPSDMATPENTHNVCKSASEYSAVTCFYSNAVSAGSEQKMVFNERSIKKD